jgi:uncharacterized protein YndB with AHSA1/START domain
VTFELTPEGANTKLKVTHTGLETFDGKNNPEYARARIVWKALTEDHWWGPKGMPTHVSQTGTSPGRNFSYSMKLPDGQEWWGKWVYREIVPPEKLVSIVSFTHEQGTRSGTP